MTALISTTAALACVPALAIAQPAATGASPQAQAALGGGRNGSTPCNSFTRLPVVGDKRAVAPAVPNPLANESWFVDDTRDKYGYKGYHEPAEGEFKHSAGKTKDLLGRIANTPRFYWYGKFSGDSLTPSRNLNDLRLRVCTNIAEAEAKGQVPLITTLRGQAKECNSTYNGGGTREDNATVRWYDALADAIGTSRVVIAFEPDSIGTISCQAPSRRSARIKLLRDAVTRLSQLPGATVYLEGTASDWKDVDYTVTKLRQIGIDKVRGFMLNVTHFDWTNSNVRYGREVSRKLGGKHFIVNTSANGRGPVHFYRRIGSRNRRITVNCHPQFRGLGPNPTTQTGDPAVDAFMWISRPGYSSGTCNGGPRGGDWWKARAIQLATYATELRGPEPGTRFGFRRGKISVQEASGDQFKKIGGFASVHP
jgi:endoglucanase